MSKDEELTALRKENIRLEFALKLLTGEDKSKIVEAVEHVERREAAKIQRVTTMNTNALLIARGKLV